MIRKPPKPKDIIPNCLEDSTKVCQICLKLKLRFQKKPLPFRNLSEKASLISEISENKAPFPNHFRIISESGPRPYETPSKYQGPNFQGAL